MKKLSVIVATLIVCLVAVCQTPSYGQASKEENKMAKLTQKMDERGVSEVNRRASPEARKRAKHYRKMGYQSISLPIEYMVDEMFKFQGKRKADGTKAYILEEGKFDCPEYNMAKRYVLANTKVVLAGRLQQLVMDEIRLNEAVSGDTRQIIGKLMEKGKLVTDMQLGLTELPLVLYREKGENVEVLLVIAYEIDNVVKGMNEELKGKVKKELQKDLDDFTPFFDDIDIICDGVRCRLATE